LEQFSQVPTVFMLLHRHFGGRPQALMPCDRPCPGIPLSFRLRRRTGYAVFAYVRCPVLRISPARRLVGGDETVLGYYEKRKPASRNNPQALDDGLAEWLWERSEALLSA
jgi:hypothetical protein